MKKISKEKLHLPKIEGITLRWLINIIGVIVVFFIIVFIISAFAIKNTYYSNVESILNSGASSTAVSYFSANLDVGNTLEQSATEYIDSYSYKEKTTTWIIDNDGKRTDVPHYPMKALREAIANALIHRDYSCNTEGAYIYLRIFDDRIEILNPGDLYGNNRLENLGTDNMLEVRNNTIIRLLEETTDIVENRHTGIATMRDEMKKMNLPEPEFENLRGTFKVTFRKEEQEIIAQNITENCTDNFTENCTDNEINLLELLKINPNITQVELSNKLSVSRRTISTLLAHLKERGKIERVGSDRKGYWKLLK